MIKWINVWNNQILWVCILSFLVSQAIKMFLQNDFSKNAFFKPGGMPSSHTAPAVGLVTSILLVEGATTAFVIAAAFAVVIIRDSLGVRYETGEQAKQLNKLTKIVLKKDSKMFNEVQGHQPLQVFAGAVVGVVVAVVVYYIWL